MEIKLVLLAWGRIRQELEENTQKRARIPQRSS